ncbi:MAG: CPBP family intramembrane metalloprotease [Phycisphaerales bacterium]|nr:CPBP family intramembrane metalloprotease [Phycisphaerales bacterium]
MQTPTSGRWTRWLILSVILGLFAAPALAQVVDTGDVQSMRVDDVVETMKKWNLALLGISAVLVIALLFAGGLLKPGGFKEAGLRDIDTMPAIVWIFAAFVVYLAATSAPSLIIKIQWVQDQDFNQLQMDAINSASYYLFGIIAGFGMLFVLARSAPECGLKLSFLDIPVGLGCFVLAYPFIGLMSMLGVFIYEQTQQQSIPNGPAHETLQQLIDNPNNPWMWAIIAGAVIGAPIVEELVFRVFLQGALIKWLKTPWLSIILSAIAFAMIHKLGGTVPWYALPILFAVGMGCGVAYERTKRVGVPITMHICFNALNVLLAITTQPANPVTGV